MLVIAAILTLVYRFFFCGGVKLNCNGGFFSHGQGIDKSSDSSAAHTVLVNKNKRYLEEKGEAGRARVLH